MLGIFPSKEVLSKQEFQNSTRKEIVQLVKNGIQEWSKRNFESAEVFLKEAQRKSLNVRDSQLYITSTNNLGLLFNSKGEYSRAREHYQVVLDYLPEEMVSRSRLLALLNMGRSFELSGDQEKAIRFLTKTMEYAENFPPGKELASCYNEIATVKLKQKLFVEALEFFQKSLQIKENIGYEKGIAGSLNNIGDTYREMGQLEMALDFYRQSLSIKEKIGNKKLIATTCNNIGMLYIQLEDYELAKNYLSRSINLKEEIKDKIGVVNTCISFGHFFRVQKNYAEAEKYLTRGNRIVEEVGSLDLKKEIYKELKNLYLAKKEFDKMTTYYDLYVEAKDEIFNLESRKSINQIQIKYQTREKEQQIEVLNIEKEAKAQESLYMKIVLGVFLFSMLPLAFFIKQRQKTRLLQERIAGENRECNRISRDLHDGVASSLSHLCRSIEKEDTEQEFAVQLRKISDEVRSISHQLNMTAIGNQKFREALSDSLPLDHFPEDIDLKIHLSEDFEIDDYKKKIYIIRIVQELINNSLKHAQASTIIIKFKKDNSKLQLEYADDGVGVDFDKISKGNGYHNIHERAEFLSGKLKIESSEGNGFYLKMVV